MKIQLLVSRAGANFSQAAGEQIDVSDAEGRRMIEAGQAVLVRSAKPEKAVAKRASEKAVK